MGLRTKKVSANMGDMLDVMVFVFPNGDTEFYRQPSSGKETDIFARARVLRWQNEDGAKYANTLVTMIVASIRMLKEDFEKIEKK